MHELSIAMSILESLEEEVERTGCGPVDAVHVRIGLLSGVVPEALAAAYEMAAAETPFERSRLVIEQVPIMIHCTACDRDQQVASAGWLCCPQCRMPSAEIVSGRELEICALELAV